MIPLNQKCKTDYKAFHNSGVRNIHQIIWVVMHSTEGGTAQGVAGYFTTHNAGGSTQLVIDDKDCYRCLADNVIPWGAQGANTKGFHIEQCGFAKWSMVIWRKHLRTLRRAAYKAAVHCHKFNIPPTFVTAKGLTNGQKGITTHAECTKAFGGSHTDPGKFWPRRLFIALVKRYLRQINSATGV